MSDISFTDLDAATAVLRTIAAENHIGLRFGEHHMRSEMLGDAPTALACIIHHEGLVTACTRSPAATPNVIEPLMHEMAHAVLGDHDDLDGDDRLACRMVIEWAARLPGSLTASVIEQSQEIIDDYDGDSK
jgi:hypothetical protein